MGISGQSSGIIWFSTYSHLLEQEEKDQTLSERTHKRMDDSRSIAQDLHRPCSHPDKQNPMFRQYNLLILVILDNLDTRLLIGTIAHGMYLILDIVVDGFLVLSGQTAKDSVLGWKSNHNRMSSHLHCLGVRHKLIHSNSDERLDRSLLVWWGLYLQGCVATAVCLVSIIGGGLQHKRVVQMCVEYKSSKGTFKRTSLKFQTNNFFWQRWLLCLGLWPCVCCKRPSSRGLCFF